MGEKDLCEELIRKDRDTIMVDWEYFCDAEIFTSGTWSEIKYRTLTNILIDLGIFSFESLNNFRLVAADGVLLNPHNRAGWFFFTREEDAVEYAKMRNCAISDIAH
jgi:hypothetical protein